jgi:predicted amidohydrolase YtcJ
MSKSAMSRKTFLKLSGGAVAGALLGRTVVEVLGAETSPADVVFRNGPIVTVSDKFGVVEALAVRGNSILAVGTDQQIAPLVGPRTKVVDLKGRSVSPGLIDAHSHPMAYGHMEMRFVILRPPKIHSFRTLGEELANAAARVPKGQWIVGRGFDVFDEGRFPRRWELDRYVPDHPVLIIHWGGQFGVANTLALQKAGLLSKDVQDPYGGKYLRSARDGLPDGVLIHYPAIYSVHEDRLSDEENQKCAAFAFERFARAGVTCIHDNFCMPAFVRLYVQMARSGRVPLRLRLYPYVANLEICRRVLAARRPLVSDTVRLAGIKLAVDGYALMYEVPEDRRHMAIPMHPQDKFNTIIAQIHGAGLQADVHAVGDKGVDWTLAAFEQAAGSAQGVCKMRHRIEHFPFRKTDSIRKAADMGVPLCTQPALIDVRADDFLRDFQRLGSQGRQLVQTMVPLRTFQRENVAVCFGADVPAFPSYQPLDSIRCAMERRTPSGAQLDSNESVGFLDALKMHTLASAHAAFDEDKLGSLEPGKLADLVVWSRDLRKVASAHDLSDLGVLATYVGGKAVYTSPAFKDA